MMVGIDRATERSRFGVLAKLSRSLPSECVASLCALCAAAGLRIARTSLSADLSGPWPDMSIEPWRQGIVSSSLAASAVRAAIPRGNPIRAQPRNFLWRSAMLASPMTANHFAERLLLIKQKFGRREYGTDRKSTRLNSSHL